MFTITEYEKAVASARSKAAYAMNQVKNAPPNSDASKAALARFKHWEAEVCRRMERLNNTKLAAKFER